MSLYRIELLQPITGISAAAIKREQVNKINWNGNELYFSEEIHSIIGSLPLGIKRITLMGENQISMGEYTVTPFSILKTDSKH